MPKSSAALRRSQTTRRSFFEGLEDRSLMATLTWVGDVDTNWNTNSGGTNTNWSSDLLPSSGDTLIFAGAAPGTLNNDTTAGNVYSLQFTGGTYTISGNAITLNPAAILPVPVAYGIQNTAALTETINTPLTLAGTSNLVDVTNASGVVTLGGTISGGATNGFVKDGQGTMNVLGNNTYSGVTTLNRGATEIRTATALGATGAASNTIVNGNDGTTSTTLRLNPAAGVTLAENLTLKASATGRVSLTNQAQNNIYSGAIDVSSTGTLVQFNANGGGFTVTGDVTGTMTGGALLFVRGTSTSTLNHLQGSVNLVGGPLNKTDTSLWLVGTAGKTYSWTSTGVFVGTLRMNLANVLPAAADVTIGQNDTNSATLDLNGFNQTVQNVTYNYAGTAVTSTGAITTGAGTLTLNGNVAFNCSNGLTTGNGSITGNLNLGGGTRTFTITDSTASTSEFTINATITNGGLTKAGPGTLRLLGNGSTNYTGQTTISAGTLQLNSTASKGISDLSQVSVGAGATLDLNNSNETIGSLTGGGNVTLGTGTLTLGGDNTSGADFSGVISGSGGVRKIGTGTQILSGNNSYTGQTSVYQGVLQGASASALGSSAGNTTTGSLAHRYSFSETGGSGTALVDSVGTVNGTIVEAGANNATVGSGQVTLAGGAQGASDYVSFPGGLVSKFKDATIELWATQLGVQNWSRIFDFGRDTNEYLLMSWTQATTLTNDRIEWKDEANSNVIVNNTMQPYNLGQQFHIVMTIDEEASGPGTQTAVTWYLNGVQKGTQLTPFKLNQLQDTNVWLGRSEFGGDNTANASYNEFRLYSTALTSAQVAANTAAGPDVVLNTYGGQGTVAVGAGVSLSEPLSLSGSGSGGTGALRNVSGTTVYTGPITLSGDARIQADAGTTLSLDVTAGNSVAGTTQTLTIGGDGNINVLDPINLTTGGLTKTGNGTVTLATANVYDGTTTVQAGNLDIANNNSLGSTAGGTVVAAPTVADHRYSFNGTGGNGKTIVDSVGSADGLLYANDASALTGNGKLNLIGGNSANAGYVDLPNGLISNLTGITVESWFVWNGNGAGGWQRLFDFGTNTFGDKTGPGGTFNGTSYLFITPQEGTTGPARLELRNDPTTQILNIPTFATGTVLHAAATFDDATNTATFYLNGVAAATSTGFTNTLMGINDVNNWIGRSNFSGDANFGGQIDEFRIYNRALTAAEIASSFAAGTEGTQGSLRLVGTGMSVAENITLNGNGASGLGALQSSTANTLAGGTITMATDASIGVNAATLTVNSTMTGAGDWSKFGGGNLLLGGNNTYSGALTITSGTVTVGSNTALGTTAGSTIISSTAPKNRYSFSGTGGIGSSIVDSASGQNGVLRGSDASNLNGAGQLVLGGGSSATAGYADLPNGLLAGLTNATFETWLNWNGGGDWQRIADFGTSNIGEVNGPGGAFDGATTNYVFISPRAGIAGNPELFELKNGGVQRAQGPTTLPASQQVHFAVSFDDTANTVRIYLNGALVSTTAGITNVFSAINDVNNWLGRSQFSGDPNFGGLLDEFRIYPVALTDADITRSFVAGPNATLAPATLVFQGNYTSSENITVDANGGTLRNVSGNTVLTGTVAPNGPTIVAVDNAGETVTLSSTLAGTSSLTKTGPGTLLVSNAGANTLGSLIVNGGLVRLTAGTTTVAGNVIVADTASGTLDIAGGNLTETAGVFVVGDQAGATGTVNHSAGTLNTNGSEIWISTANTAVGVYNLTGGTINVATWLAIGRGGDSGTLNISGGTVNVTANNVTIGSFGGSAGTVNVSGTGQLTATNGIWVGEGGKGILNVSGGTVAGGYFNVGRNGGSSGALNQSGGAVTFGTGPEENRIGNNGGSYGYVNVSNGTMTWNGNVQVAYAGTGILDITGGTVNSPGGFPVVGRFTGGFGVMTITAGQFNQTNGGTFFIDAEQGTGTLNVSGGAVALQSTLRVGHTGTGVGAVNLTGGTVTAPNVTDNGGNSRINFNGGTLRPTAASTTFFQGLDAATIYAGGATFDSNVNISVNQSLLAPTGNGVLTIPVAAGGSGYIGAPAVQISGGGGTGATARAIVTGGVVTSIVITSPGVGYTAVPAVTLVGGSPTTAATIGAVTIGVVTGGGLTKTGAGRLDLTNASNTYTGVTSAAQGTLALASGGTNNNIAASSNINLTAGATLNVTGLASGQLNLAPAQILSGTGNVTGNIGGGAGIVSPGNSPGAITVTGNFGPVGTINFEVNGYTTPGTDFDRINVIGGVNLSGTNLTFSGTAPAPSPTQVVTLIDNDTAADPTVTSGATTPANNSVITINGNNFFLNYNGGDGNDVIISKQLFGTGGADTLVVRQQSATMIEISLNGAPFQAFSNAVPFGFNGGAGNDLVLVDTSNGDPIPTGDINFSSVEFLRVEKTTGAASDAAVVTPTAVTITGFGDITLGGTTNVDVVNFTSVAVRTATANDTLTLANGSTITNGGTLPAGYSIAAAADVQVTGTGGIVVGARNVGTLTIDTVTGGGNGNDTVTITSANNAHGIANLTINTGTGTDSIAFSGAAAISGVATLTSGGTITNTNPGTDLTAAALAATAATGIVLDTAIANLEAQTATGGITLSNTGALQIGNVTAALSGVDVTGASGDISLTATGTINALLHDEDIFGPGNITLNAQGANSDVNTGGANSIGSVIQTTGAAALLSITAGRDVVMGTTGAGDYGDTYSAGSILINAGRDYKIQQFTFLDVNGTGSNTINAGQDIIVVNDGTYSRITTRGGVINLTAGRNINAVSNSGAFTIDSTQAGAAPVGANVNLTATNGSITLTDGVAAGTGGTVKLVANAGSITDTNVADGFKVIGNTLVATAANGVTLAASVGTLAAENTTSGDIVVVNSNGLLTLANVSPVTAGFSVRNTAPSGLVSITNADALTVSAAVTSPGAVTLTAVDAAAAGQNITTNASVTSTGASVALNAGDNVTVNAAVNAATTVTINVDAGAVDAGTGSTVTIAAAVTTPAVGSGGGTFINGGTDSDTVILNPQTTTEFRVFGDAPATSPGDILKMNVTGLNATLSAPGSTGIYTGQGSGDWTFGAGQQPVRFGAIETLDITGSYHLAYNNDVTKSANLVVLLNGGGLEIHDGTAGGPLLLGPVFGTLLSLTINGNNDVGSTEQVTIDDVGGLPVFTSTPVLSPDNATVAGLPGMYFQGNNGTNILAFNLTQANTTQIVGLGDGTTGSPDANAEVATTSAGGSLNVYGSSLTSVQRTGSGATPGALTIQAEGGNDAINITGSGNATTIAATNYVPFTFSAIDNYSAENILGNDGNDSITLTSLGGGTTNVAPITLSGGNGNDTIDVGNTSLAAIGAAVTVSGGANSDTLNVTNSGSMTANTNVVVREDAIDNITGRNSSNDVTYGTVETLNVFTSLVNDNITVALDGSSPSSVVTATINGSGGNDQFVFTSATTPSLDFLNLQGGTGNDVFGTPPAGPVGSAPVGGEFVPTTGVRIVVSGESSTSTSGPNPSADNDQLNLNISSFNTAEIVDTGSGQVLSLGSMPAHDPFYFNGVEDLNLYDNNKLTNTEIGDLYLRSTNDNVNDNILFYKGYTSPNDVLIRFNNQLASTTPFLPTTRLVAYGRGGSDRIELNYTIGKLKAVFYGEEGNDYLTGSLSSDLLVGGAGADQLIGGDASDVLWGDQEGLTWAQRSGDNSLASTDGNDTLEGDAGDDFMFGGGGNDQLTGMTGNDYLHGGYGADNLVGADGNDLLRGGDGNDQLTGDKGNDILLAGLGDDFLYGGADRDFAFSGAGVDRNYETNDTGEDVNITENQSLELDAANPSYDAANSATFFSPNDTTLLALMTTWSAATPFATRAAAAQSTLLSGSSSDGSLDYLVGNTLTLDYSIVAATTNYTNSSGDTIDTVS